MAQKITVDETALTAFANQFVKSLKPGAIIFLVGELGAGKTTFVKACARALGADQNATASPTFVVMREYAVSSELVKRVLHVDGYRLKRGDHPELGIEEELAQPGTIAFIEWPDRFLQIRPTQTLVFTINKNETRTITLT